MLFLSSLVDRIDALLIENTQASVTYAALEARLALEKVCYNRLREAHDYISHDDVKRWQPSAVINQLLQEVDPWVATTRTLSISTRPRNELENFEAADYQEIGTEIGFNPKKVASLWNALSRLALHVELPQSRDSEIPDYGDFERIKAKVIEAREELARLSKTTISMSGFGPEVSFNCDCGTLNRRKAEYLSEGQSISCVNARCRWSWRVRRDGEDYLFEPEAVTINCGACGTSDLLPLRPLRAMGIDNTGSWNCTACGTVNVIRWKLVCGIIQQ